MYAGDRKKTQHLLDEAARKARRDRGWLEEAGENLGNLLRLLRAWATRAYTVVPWRTLVLAIAAVVYFVNPFDLSPDFLPLVGYVDDVTVLAFVLQSIRKDLDQFLAWEEEGKTPVSVPYWSADAR